MNLSKVFAYGENMVRTAGTAENPLFVAADVCRALGIEQATRAVENFSESEKGVNLIHTLGGGQEMLVVSEAGLYRLIFRSDKPAARKFQEWVFSEVLPSIRKTGGYGLDERGQLWEALAKAKTGAVQMAILGALGIGSGSELKAAPRLFVRTEPDQVWADLANGWRAGALARGLVRLAWGNDCCDFYISPRVLEALRAAHPERYGRMDRKDLKSSLMLAEEWVGNENMRMGLPGEMKTEAVWRFRAEAGPALEMCKVISESGNGTNADQN